MSIKNLVFFFALASLSANLSFALSDDEMQCSNQCKDKCAQEIKRSGVVTREEFLKKAIENCAVSCQTNECKIYGKQLN